MQHFVQGKHRAASPQNDQSVHLSSRQAQGANAKVLLKQGRNLSLPPPNPALPSRVITNAQNMSVAIQRPVQQQRFAQDQVQTHDPFDTDAESIDTTINQSVIQDEHGQNARLHHHQDGPFDQIVDDLDVEQEEGDEASNQSHGDYEQHQNGDADITPEDMSWLEQAGLTHLPPQEQLAFLQERNHGFHTVDGDSYPTTTDGNPTEMETGGDLSEERKYAREVSPSPQRPARQTHSLHARAPYRSLQSQPAPFQVARQREERPSIYQQGANVRNQQRTMAQSALLHGDTVHTVDATMSAHPPNYSQPNPRQNIQHQIDSNQQHVQHHHSNPARKRIQAPRQLEPIGHAGHSVNASASRPAQTRGRLVEQGSISRELTQPEDIRIAQSIDYDEDALQAMDFNQLKNESFDHNPRSGSSVITDDILQKPLAERLQFVFNNFDPHKQTEFFHSLPTHEWEDAGDWFLEQFQSIVQRSRGARRKKRTLAQEFETAVEKRYDHVSKKQRQVQEAMNKMKEQGESLVPKSPSPRPRRF